MKPRLLLILAGASLLVLVVLVALGPGQDPDAPRFVPGTPASIGPALRDHYNWNADAPFENGKVWVWTLGTNMHSYLYDLDRRAAVGELFRAGDPVLWSRDHSRLLVRGPPSPATSLRSFGIRAVNAVRRVFGAKRSPPGKRVETFWILNTADNSTMRLGALSQFAGTGSEWHPSPDFRRGYTMPTTTFGSALFLCDLEAGSITRVAVPGQPKGWWDERQLLIESGHNQFDLFDVDTRKTHTLFSAAAVAAFLSSSGLTNDPAGLGAFANWNGHDYDFYFGIKDRINGLKNPDSFLAKANRAGPALTLLYRHFEFHWGGHLDSTATHYLYQGESGAPGSGGDGAVYLRDLTTGETITLVTPDNKGQYAIPRFYGNEVIYFRNRLLRRVGIEASNDAPLLPVNHAPGKVVGREP